MTLGATRLPAPEAWPIRSGGVSVHGNRVIFMTRWRTESDEATGEVAKLGGRREWSSRSVVHESGSGRALKVGHHTFTQEVEQ